MVKTINDSKTLMKLISCECKCKIKWCKMVKPNSNYKLNEEMRRCEIHKSMHPKNNIYLKS